MKRRWPNLRRGGRPKRVFARRPRGAPRWGRTAKVLVPLLAIGAGVFLAYWLLVRDTTVIAELKVFPATAVIGEGEDEVGVSREGAVLAWLQLPEGAELPRLPLSEPPRSGRLAGPALQQAKVLGAAPPPLRPYVARSYYGESGVDVELRSGIELRFGDASQAAVKWQAAATILADPSITSLDYVDLHVPRRPAVYGEGHLLPAAP